MIPILLLQLRAALGPGARWADLAAALGVAPATLYHWRAGREPGLSTFQAALSAWSSSSERPRVELALTGDGWRLHIGGEVTLRAEAGPRRWEVSAPAAGRVLATGPVDDGRLCLQAEAGPLERLLAMQLQELADRAGWRQGTPTGEG